MTVEEILNAILESARARLRNGEFTERALARRMDVSQAHMHNVLKGARTLTPPLADRLTAALGISLEARLVATAERLDFASGVRPFPAHAEGSLRRKGVARDFPPHSRAA